MCLEGVEFLIYIFRDGYAYSTINLARSALSNILAKHRNCPFGYHTVVSRIMSGYQRRPQMSRYQATWDVCLAYEMLREWNSNSDLSVKMLSLKLVLVMLPSSYKRVQTLSILRLGDLLWKDNHSVATFRMSS